MALEDFIEPEVGVAVAVTAAIASPQVRQLLRKGAVYGLAGIFMAGDAVSSLARGAQRGFKEAAQTVAPSSAAGASDAADDSAAPAQGLVVADSYGSVTPTQAKRSKKIVDVTTDPEGEAS